MRWFIVLVFGSFILASCAKVETSSTENTSANLNKTASVSPTIEAGIPLKPLTPKVKLNSKQKKYLDESLPPPVREILEKAEKFQVLAEVREQERSEFDITTFQPNRIAMITDENIKQKILEIFYKDASTNESAANCYEPHHSLRATYQGKTVEIEICFDCARFYVKIFHVKESFGTIRRENRKSEDFFNQIIQNQSVEIK